MRIAFFHELPPGGARIATNEIALRLKKTNKVDLYYVDGSEEISEYKNYTKVYFYKFLEKEWTGKDPFARIYKDTVELKKLSALHKKIADVIDSRGYDLVFVNASKFVESPFILKYLKTKSVFYLHDPHFRMVYEKELDVSEDLDVVRKTYEKLHRKLLKKMDLKNLKSADYLIANSRFSQQTAFKSYRRESLVAYLGIDTDFFKSSNKKRVIDILFVGSKSELDGYPLLLKSLEKMKKEPKIRLVLKESEWVSREKMRELYQRSKLVVALASNEPFGLTPLEAAACGVPTVAVDEAGHKETIIDGKTGYLVSKNPSELAQKLDYLLSNPKRLKQLGIQAKENAVENWGWSKKIEILEKTLKGLLGNE